MFGNKTFDILRFIFVDYTCVQVFKQNCSKQYAIKQIICKLNKYAGLVNIFHVLRISYFMRKDKIAMNKEKYFYLLFE